MGKLANGSGRGEKGGTGKKEACGRKTENEIKEAWGGGGPAVPFSVRSMFVALLPFRRSSARREGLYGETMFPNTFSVLLFSPPLGLQIESRFGRFDRPAR